MSVAAITDLVALVLLGLAVLGSVPLAIFSRERSWVSLVPPFLAVTVAHFLSYPVAQVGEYAAMRILMWLGLGGLLVCAVSWPKGARWLVIGVAGFVSCWTLGEAGYNLLQGKWGRVPRLLVGNPVPISSILLVALPVVSDWLYSAGVGSFIAMLLTGTRGAVAAWLLSKGVRLRLWQNRAYLHAFAVVFLLALGGMMAVRPTNRLAIWEEGVRIFLQHPWRGVGANNYEFHTTLPFRFAHNTLLTAFVTTGVIGGLAWIYWLVSVGILVYRSSHKAKWGLLAFGFQQMVDCTFWNIWTGIVVMAIIGLVIADIGDTKDDDDTAGLV